MNGIVERGGGSVICTTLNAIREHHPCYEGWVKLLVHLDKTDPDDEPLPLVVILDSNGLDDALWALRAVTGEDARIRRYAVWCARQVQHLMKDSHSIQALEMAERHTNGMATDDELKAVVEAAYVAAMDMAGNAGLAAASSAAWAAAWAAARTAARAAARSEEYAAMRERQAEKFREVFCGGC